MEAESPKGELNASALLQTVGQQCPVWSVGNRAGSGSLPIHTYLGSKGHLS